MLAVLAWVGYESLEMYQSRGDGMGGIGGVGVQALSDDQGQGDSVYRGRYHYHHRQ